MYKKLCVFILVAIALAPIFILQAQTSTTNFSLYVGQEGKIKTINLSNYYEVTSIEFKSDDPNYSQYLNLEIREINSERDFIVTPTQYFDGTASVTLTVFGRFSANGSVKELVGPLKRTISCKDNPLVITPEYMTLNLTDQQNGFIDYWHKDMSYENAVHVSFHPESDIISVDPEGNVIAKKSGETYIRVHSNQAKDDKICAVEVKGKSQAERISIDPAYLTLTVDKKDTITAMVEPYGAEYANVIWTIQDDTDAIVIKELTQTTAEITAKKQGNATVIASIADTNIKANCQVAVEATTVGPSKIALDKETMTITVEDQDTLKAIISPANAEYAAIDWKSSNEEIALVKRMGKTTAIVTAISKGTVTITATVRGTNLKANSLVTVSPLTPERIRLNHHSLSIEKGNKKTLTATVTPVDAEYQIDWSSTDESIVTVKRKTDSRVAEVVAKGKGSATIIAIIDGTNLKDSCRVNSTITPTDIEMPSNSYEVLIGDEFCITPSVGPDGAEYTLDWGSNDPDVAVVDQTDMSGKTGRVSTLNAGEAIITATIVGTGIHESCRVIVKKPTLTLTAAPNGGIVNKGTKVVLSANSIGAKIYYTTDGTIPDQFDHLYRTPIIINQDTKIKAIAIQDGYNNSDILTASFVIRNIPGDVNKDDEVSIADINSVISTILDNDNDQSWQWADINNDGEVTIADINAVIDVILNPKQYIQEVEPFFVNGVEFDMIYVEGGTFTMGTEPDDDWDPEWGPDEDPYQDSHPAHEVTLNSFRIGQTEVTKELWEAVMGPNSGTGSGTNINDPMEGVTWYECQDFIKRLNIITGKQFRLPTEAEWEYVANKIFDEDGYYNYSIPVYNMRGGAHEWCIDWYGPYTDQPQVNPIGPLVGTDRVMRGTSDLWESLGNIFNYTIRIYGKPDESGYYAGLRLVLSDVEIYTVNDVSFAMLPVKGGTFAMGDDHQSTVSNYSIGQTEVTQALWKAVMGDGDFSSEVYCHDPEGPVVYWLGEYEGSGLIYGPYREFSMFIEVLNAITGRSFRFLKDVEWEYAARGGSMSQGYEYAGSDDVNEVAWYGQEFTNTPAVIPVGSLSPNELGLYDMSGNAYEMCEINDYLSIRGGCWYSNPQECSVYWSDYLDELGLRRYGGGALGFRLALGNSANPIIELDRYHTTIKVGETAEIEILHGNGNYKCTSSNSSISCRIVGDKVLIDGEKIGTAEVTVTDLVTSAITTFIVCVISANTTIELDKTSLELHEGETKTLTASIIPANPNCSIVWYCNKPGLVSLKSTVKNTVEATALHSDGTATISASIDDTDIEARCSVTVE